ncbi:MAG: hypothetical protein DCC75_00825 [Proteobacteria bacterium]|nr:MAG: hypothetical protein DCC75_00825 [Pseudomonadota bacterium]
MNSKPLDLNAVFGNAASQNLITDQTLHTLTSMDLGDQIQNALGLSADAIESSEVFLLSILVDDSSSIHQAGNEDNVRRGVNICLEALKHSKAENDILAHVTALNRGTIYPYRPIAQAPQLGQVNYQASGNTPLYDMSIAVLGTALAKEREFAAQGVPVRTATLIVTDGADYGSRKRPRDVASLVADLKKRENHIIAAMGIDDGGQTDFRKIFQSMGIDDRWILTPDNDPHSIREAFEVFSKSAVQASQGAASFSKVSGFNP